MERIKENCRWNSERLSSDQYTRLRGKVMVELGLQSLDERRLCDLLKQQQYNVYSAYMAITKNRLHYKGILALNDRNTRSVKLRQKAYRDH